MINIGRHSDNDIIIDSPNVAPFHAVIDYRQWPCQVILLSGEGQTTMEGQQLVANSPTTMDNWNTIKVDGYDIILLHGTAGAPRAQPSVPVGTPMGAPVPPPMGMPMDAPPFEQPMTVISAGPAAPTVPPAAAPAGVPVETLSIGPEQTDDYIATELTEDTWEIDVEQTASTQLTIMSTRLPPRAGQKPLTA